MNAKMKGNTYCRV